MPLVAALFAVAWPAANFFSHNYLLIQSGGGSFRSIAFFTAAFGATVTCAALVLALTGAAGLGRSMLIATAVLFPLLFVFSPLNEALFSLLEAHVDHGRIVSAAAFFVLWLGMGAAAWKLAENSRAVTGLAIFFAVACAIPVSVTAIQAATAAPRIRSEIFTGDDPLIAPGAKGQHNVYYVIFDSYPGLEVTDKYFHIDNRNIVNFLEGEGFFSAGDFQSNYFQTFLTLTAILNAAYTVDSHTPAPLDMGNFYPDIYQRGDRMRAVQAFRALGYRTYSVGNGYARCKPGIFVCLNGGAYSADRSFSAFIADTPWPALVAKVRQEKFDGDWNATHPLLDALPGLIARSGRKFVFAHNIPPHPPAIYEADCSPAIYGNDHDMGWRYSKLPYEKNLACVNRQIMELVRALVAADPDAVIVIQSDHGSFTSLAGVHPPAETANVFEISRPINFIRAPQACRRWLYKGITQINTMRFVLGCAQGRQPRYLPDISYADMSSRPDVHGPFVRQLPPRFPPEPPEQVIK